MGDVYLFFKSFTDPVLIIFTLLLISLITCLVSSRKKSSVLPLFLAIVLLYGASISPVANYFAYNLEKDYLNSKLPFKNNLDAIIVLGGGVSDINSLNSTFLSEATAARLIHAIEIYNKYGAKYFICAGTSGGRISDAEVMAQTALALGVPKEKIKIDTKSTNTWEHAVELNKIVQNKNIYLGVVTSGDHMKRSEAEFKKYFSNVIPFPANYFYSSASEKLINKYIPQTSALNLTTITLREIIGSLWYRIKT
jgi:uncharacterized SAM-binding protein YcdF (DUF218 family)